MENYNEIKKFDDDISFETTLETLKKAFINDPMFNYLSSNEKNRKLLISNFFESFLINRPHGIHQIGDCDCIGHWIIHPKEEINIYEMALKGGLFTIWNVDISKWINVLKILRHEEIKQKEYLKDEKSYIYISTLCTNPEEQGKGHCNKMLNYLIDQADKLNLCCYLETANPIAKTIYEKFNFYVLEEYRVCNEAPPLWFMRRDHKYVKS